MCMQSTYDELVQKYNSACLSLSRLDSHIKQEVKVKNETLADIKEGHTEYDTAIESEPKQTPPEICRKIPQQACQDVTKKECSKHTERKCDAVAKEICDAKGKCVNVPSMECRDVPQQTCRRTVPHC